MELNDIYRCDVEPLTLNQTIIRKDHFTVDSWSHCRKEEAQVQPIVLMRHAHYLSTGHGTECNADIINDFNHTCALPDMTC